MCFLYIVVSGLYTCSCHPPMQVEDWLYTDGEDASASEFQERLDTLKSIGDPIFFRSISFHFNVQVNYCILLSLCS